MTAPRRSAVRAHGLAAAWAVLGAASGCGAREPAGPPAGHLARPTETAGIASNVRFEDYAGSAACAGCHPTESARLAASPMHRMTRDARTAAIAAPFAGEALPFKNDRATLGRDGGDRFVTLSRPSGATETYRVTRVIGGRVREDFAGVLVADARAGAPVLGDGEEVVLPVSFLLGPRKLRYKGYSVLVPERPGLKAGPVWSKTCIFCHNTPPWLSTSLGPLAGRGAGPYQGQVVDGWLPEARRQRVGVSDAHALEAAFAAELERLGATGAPTARGLLEATRRRFDARHLVEVGIGCEACHLGAKAHAVRPTTRPSLVPRGAGLAVELPSRAGAEQVNHACARCHQVLFSGYDPTWEGGSRRGRAGGSPINSGEARDFLLGGCASQMACTDCHEPHGASARALREAGAHALDATCVRCHGALAAEPARRAHTHHAPEGEGSACVSCHMPRKNMGLDGALTRYHRIGSPNDPARTQGDRPLECGLCHGDRTAEELARTMESWWPTRVPREGLRALYGDAGAREDAVLVATLARGKPHEVAAAARAARDQGLAAAVPALVPHLAHPLPLVRSWASDSLDALRGAPTGIDLDASEAELAGSIRSLAKPAAVTPAAR